MQSLVLRRIVALAALVGAVILTGSAPAAGKKAASLYAAEIKELHEIKVVLEQANHDYKGHRAEAVKHLTHAIHALEMGHKHPNAGTGVKGGREPQALSDVQLKASIKALHAVLKNLNSAPTAPATKGATHVAGAIKELETALKIR